MALSRVKTWIAGETLTAADLNAEFSNIINNPTSLISPLTAALDMDANVIQLDGDQDTTITADTDDRIDFALSGTDLIRFDGTAATPVNGLTFIARATGSKPSVQALTSDSNEGLDLRDDNGNEILVLSSVASAVNEITITAAAAGSEPSIAATGDDTDIDVDLVPKGAGVIKVGGSALILDEDDMASDSATQVPSQQSTKAYVDSSGPRGFIDGLVLANNGTDADHDIDIAAGEARDDGDAIGMKLSSTLVKQIDASWVVGTNQGGLDGTESVAGTPDASTWYHLWLIRRSDTGVVDALYSESATSPTMPTNYDQKRRIGAVLTDGSANITAFIQKHDTFWWKVEPSADYNTDPAAAEITTAMTVPTGIGVQAIVGASLLCTGLSGSNTITWSVYHPDITAPTPANRAMLTLRNTNTQTTESAGGGVFYVDTDTSAQIQHIMDDAGSGTQTLTLVTLGWVDPRGRDG